MEDQNIKPSVVPSIYHIEERLKTVGLTREDLITLIQRETKLSRTIINKTMKALYSLEMRLK